MSNEKNSSAPGTETAWYYEKRGQRVGPLSEADVKKRMETGEITSYTMLQQENGTRVAAYIALQKPTSPPTKTTSPTETIPVTAGRDSGSVISPVPIVPPPQSRFANPTSTAPLPSPPPPPDALAACPPTHTGLRPIPLTNTASLSWDDIKQLSQWQRHGNTAILLLLPIYALAAGAILWMLQSIGLKPSAAMDGVLRLVLQVVATVIQVAFVIGIVRTLKCRNPWSWGIGAIFPVIGLFVLYRASRIATKTLQAQGLSVGILGAYPKSNSPDGWEFTAPVIKSAGGYLWSIVRVVLLIVVIIVVGLVLLAILGRS